MSTPGTLRAISLWQPHAALMASGDKGVESRGRTFGHRGPLAIAATASIPAEFRSQLTEMARREPFRTAIEAGWFDCWTGDLTSLPMGAILAVVWVDTETRIRGELMRSAIAAAYGAAELRFGNYADGRVAIHTDRARLMRLPEPVPCKGSQGLWYVPANVLGQLAAQLRTHTNFHHHAGAFGAFARDTSDPTRPAGPGWGVVQRPPFEHPTEG